MAQLQMGTYYYTPEEYLALEDAAEYKSEYVRGKIFPRSGENLTHNEIMGNILTCFHLAFKTSDCDVYGSQVKVFVSANDAFLYPDVMVLCGQPEFFKERRDTICNPILVVEVLSESIRDYNGYNQFDLYRGVEILQDYLLVDQHQIQVQHYHKLEENRWLLTIFTQLESVIDLPSVDITLPLSEIYHKVKFPNAE